MYVNERTELFNKLAQIKFTPTVTNLLNGSEKYSVEKNEQAFNHIHNYINATKRFV